MRGLLAARRATRLTCRLRFAGKCGNAASSCAVRFDYNELSFSLKGACVMGGRVPASQRCRRGAAAVRQARRACRAFAVASARRCGKACKAQAQGREHGQCRSKKWAALAAAGALAASLALFGCSSGGDGACATGRRVRTSPTAEADGLHAGERGQADHCHVAGLSAVREPRGRRGRGPRHRSSPRPVADELGLELRSEAAAVRRHPHRRRRRRAVPTWAFPASRSIPNAPSRLTSPTPTTSTTRPSPP